ncbi:serine hydrolase domain-containing protein [Pradoshia sp.]
MLAERNMEERMQHVHVTGLSVATVRNAQMIAAEQFGLLETRTTRKLNSESLLNACSISKFLTAMLVMLLNEKGVVDLDEDINRNLVSWHVPDNDFMKNKPVTLRNLLSHQSGIIDPEKSFPELDSNDGIPSMADLLKGETSYCEGSIKVQYEPGSDFHYSDAGYCLIQLLIEDVTGKTFAEMVDELIFHPLNMENSMYPLTISEEERGRFSCGHTKNGEVVDGQFPIYPYSAASGLWTTSTDLSLVVIELMNALNGKSKLGLSVSKAKEMITPQGCKPFTGLGVFLDGAGRELEVSSLGWGLGFQCMMVCYPYKETGLIIMTNTDMGVHQMKGIIGEIYRSFTARQ